MSQVDFEKADHQLDAIGMRWPEPVLMIRLNIRKIATGETLFITADDPSTTRDVPSICRFMELELVASQVAEKPNQYLIKNGSA